MAAPKNVAFRGIQDCKVAKLTADDESSLTYDAVVDVGIQKLSFAANIETYELKHDDLTQEIDQVTQSYDVTGTIARVSLDVLSVFTGSTISATGSGDAEVQTFSQSYTDDPNYFSLEIQSTRAFATDGSAGDVHVKFPKVKVTDLEVKIEDDFATIEFTGKAVRTVNTGVIKQIIVNETETAISDSAVAGTVTLSSNIAVDDSGGVIGLVLSGTTFASESAAESTDNYTIDAGTTGLSLSSVTYISEDTVALTVTGTAVAGTFGVIVEAAAVNNATDTSEGNLTVS